MIELIRSGQINSCHHDEAEARQTHVELVGKWFMSGIIRGCILKCLLIAHVNDVMG